MNELEARIRELEAEVKKLNDEVFYWRKAFDRALVAYTNLERKHDGKPELYWVKKPMGIKLHGWNS